MGYKVLCPIAKTSPPLEGYCGKGVAQGVQRNVLQVGILEDILVQLGLQNQPISEDFWSC